MREKIIFILILVISLGTILRLYDLGAESIWFDEAGSIDLTMKDLPTLFSKSYYGPLYFLILKSWIRIWGISEFALRTLSVILGIGSIFSIYKVGKILFNAKVGLLSAFLLSISPMHIFYSQEIKHYSLLIFLTLLSMFFFIKLFKENHTKLYIYLSLINILLVYTFLHSILIIVSQNVFFFVKSKGTKNRWIVSQFIVLTFFLLWFVPVLMTSFNEPWIRVSTAWIPKPSLATLIETFRTFSYGGESYGGNDFHIDLKYLRITNFLFYIFTFLSLLGLCSSLKSSSNIEDFPLRKEAVLLLSIWLFFPLLIIFLFSKLFFPIYVIRYAILSLPAFLIFTALGIDRIKMHLIRRGLVFLITILTIYALTVYYGKELKINWRGAISYINENIEDNDIIIVSIARQVRVFGYYGKNGLRYQKNGKLDIDEVLKSKLITGGFVYPMGKNKLIGVNDVEQLAQVINYRNIIERDINIWLIITRWVRMDSAEQMKKYMDSLFECKKYRNYTGLNVYYYKS